MGLAKLHDLRADADKALRLEDGKALEVVYGRVRVVFWEHYGKTRECWEFQVDLMKERAHMASDSLTYYEMLHRAEKALAAEDYGEVSIPEPPRTGAIARGRAVTETGFHDAALRTGHH